MRVNFNYFIGEPSFQFVLDAVHLVANEGYKLLPHYAFDAATGLWHHRGTGHDPKMSLRDVTYRSGKLEYRSRHATEPEWVLPSYLEQARAVLDEAVRSPGDAVDPPLSGDFESLRWFPLPGEIAAELRGETPPSAGQRALHPR
ncbi:MAG: hypothetical protein R3B82_03180 [Sandaracinaceae bacterium]